MTASLPDRRPVGRLARSRHRRRRSLDAGRSITLSRPDLLRRVHPLTVLHLGAREGFAAIGQRNLGVGLLGDAGGGLQRAVAAADDEHVLAAVLLGIDQAIDHLGLVLARNVELARGAAAADRKQHRAGPIALPRGLDLEVAAGLGDDVDALPVADLQAGLLRVTFVQKARSFSLLISLNLTLPIKGSVAGAVMTSLPRGKWATVPPKLSCSIVTKRSLCCMAARLEQTRSAADDDDIQNIRPSQSVQTSHRVDGCRPVRWRCE